VVREKRASERKRERERGRRQGALSPPRGAKLLRKRRNGPRKEEQKRNKKTPLRYEAAWFRGTVCLPRESRVYALLSRANYPRAPLTALVKRKKRRGRSVHERNGSCKISFGEIPARLPRGSIRVEMKLANYRTGSSAHPGL